MRMAICDCFFLYGRLVTATIFITNLLTVLRAEPLISQPNLEFPSFCEDSSEQVSESNLLNSDFSLLDGTDFVNISTGGIISGNETLISVQNVFQYPQLVIQFGVVGFKSPSGGHSIEQYPLLINVTIFDWDTEQSFLLTSISVVTLQQQEPQTVVYSPCELFLPGINGTNQTFSLIAIPTDREAQYNTSTLSIVLLETRIYQNTVFSSDFQMCPGIRYLSFNTPDDLFAFNMTLSSENSNMPEIFSSIYLRHEICPSISDSDINGNVYDYQIGNLSSLKSGIVLENIQMGGWWWFALKCQDQKNSMVPWTFGVSRSNTCPLACFVHGSCETNPPTCICSTWYFGDTCSDLYPGDYSLIAVGSLLFLLLFFCISWKIMKRWCWETIHKDWLDIRIPENETRTENGNRHLGNLQECGSLQRNTTRELSSSVQNGNNGYSTYTNGSSHQQHIRNGSIKDSETEPLIMSVEKNDFDGNI